jgi:hypothetical protein
MRAFTTIVAVLAALSSAGACSREHPKAAATPRAEDQARRASATAGAAQEQVGYEAGAWTAGDLNNTVVSLAQIVISHRASESDGTLPRVEPHERSKDQALEKAWQLFRTLSRQPEQFGTLARSDSDEPQTAALGGSLGVLRASSLPPEILNALAQLEPGAVSRVVETPQGYHLLRPQTVPSDSQISLSHIVIKTEESVGWRRDDRRPTLRKRAAARAHAQEVAIAAAADPSRFVDLVRAHSDADDVARDGDMGVWSRYEDAGVEFLLFEYADRLAVGGISGVIETHSGFHVLQRTPVRERTRLAVSTIALLHDSAQAQSFVMQPIRSSAKAEQMAQQLIAELSAHPDQFPQRQIEHCEIGDCAGPSVFRAGRGMVAIERALTGLAPHAIGPHPVDSPAGWLVLRREDAAALPEPKQVLRFQLPLTEAEVQAQAQAEPGAEKPDPSPAELARDLTLFSQFARERMQLSAEREAGIERLFAQLAVIAVDPSADFDLQLARTDDQLQALLGPEHHQELVRHQRVWFGAKGR